ncbi:MAG TPA: hypothetical protein VK866_14525 [Acidimicrobiales bacterium]|nr:hypothetical protein [Acidimicrobiales bacterium]
MSDRIVGHVADVTGTDPDDVRDRLDVLTIDTSSLLRVSITADDPDVAVASIDALLDAVRFGVGGQDSIPRLFLLPVSQDVEAEARQGGSSAGIVVAVVVGLLLGVLGAIGLERADVRVDAVDLAARRSGVPGSDLDELPDPSLVVLVRHWVESSDDRPCTVALLGVERAQHATTAAAANRLVDVSARHLRVVANDDDPERSGPVRDADLDVRLGGAPGTSEAGEWVAADRSHTVLVVPRGARLRDVDAAVQALRRLHLGPTWLLVTRRSRRSGTSPVTEWRERLRSGAAAMASR